MDYDKVVITPCCSYDLDFSLFKTSLLPSYYTFISHSIIESGVKHHNPLQSYVFFDLSSRTKDIAFILLPAT
jgi:hypothetical protein